MARPELLWSSTWALLLGCLAAVLAWQIHHGFSIETNFMKLLPKDQQSSFTQNALDHFAKNMNREIIFLVGHEDQDAAAQATQKLLSSLDQTNLFAPFSTQNESTHRALFQYFQPYRHQILRPNEWSNQGTYFNQNQKLLFSPLASFFADTLDHDPLLLMPRFLQRLSENQRGPFIYQGVLMAQDEKHFYGILQSQILGHPFRIEDQKKTLSAIDKQIKLLQDSFPQVQVGHLGFMHFAAESTRGMYQEISLIGAGSLLGIFLLILLVFGSWRHLVYCLIPIAVGILCALSFSSLIFSEIHIFTLVFGASLIGVCVDYTFHYFSEQRFCQNSWNSRKALSNILPGITLGLITSILGYLGLALAPFPGLYQVSAFSSLGLLGAFISVILWFPGLLRKTFCQNPQNPQASLKFSPKFLAFFFGPKNLWLSSYHACGFAGPIEIKSQ